MLHRSVFQFRKVSVGKIFTAKFENPQQQRIIAAFWPNTTMRYLCAGKEPIKESNNNTNKEKPKITTPIGDANTGSKSNPNPIGSKRFEKNTASRIRLVIP